ncbi:MAG: M23 family metallopeptidase [Candidatus Micrarchaeota archaeon]|nr:M23 family metallopeptidase [Candidatus Micrarchaeota archaeon]
MPKNLLQGANKDNSPEPLKASRGQINDKNRVWSARLDVSSPIRGEEIEGFSRWIDWNGFGVKHEYGIHRAFDFSAYLSKDGKSVLGLPRETKVRAIADGKVVQVNDLNGDYFTLVHIQHNKMDHTYVAGGMLSTYCHVTPLVKAGQKVRRGQVIATLHKDPGNISGRLVHLHFELSDAVSNSSNNPSHRRRDPLTILPSINELKAIPPASLEFEIKGLKRQPEIEIANFKKLRI